MVVPVLMSALAVLAAGATVAVRCRTRTWQIRAQRARERAHRARSLANTEATS